MKKTIRWVAPLITVTILGILAAATLGAQAPAGLAAGSASAVPVSVALGAASAATESAFEDGFRLSQPIVRVGQDYTLRAGEAAGGVRSVFGDLAVEGRVDRDAVVVLGNARVAANAVVDGSLVVIGGNATIEPGAADLSRSRCRRRIAGRTARLLARRRRTSSSAAPCWVIR